jgi:hypothetical protein
MYAFIGDERIQEILKILREANEDVIFKGL